MLSFIIVLSMMLFALYMIATRERASEGLTRESGGTKIFPLLYADISSLMALGLACSLKDRYIDLLLVVSISLYVVALTLTYAHFEGSLIFYICFLLLCFLIAVRLLLKQGYVTWHRGYGDDSRYIADFS